MPRIKRTAMGRGLAVAAALVACGASAWAQAQTPPATNDHLIVPGVRAGPYVLGMSESELLQTRRPDNRRASFLMPVGGGNTTPATLYCYADENICAFVDQSTSQVVKLQIGFDGQCYGYHTAEGVTCGADYQKISQSFDLGTPDLSLSVYNSFNHELETLGFRTDANGSKTLLLFFDMDTYRENQHPLKRLREVVITYRQYS